MIGISARITIFGNQPNYGDHPIIGGSGACGLDWTALAATKARDYFAALPNGAVVIDGKSEPYQNSDVDEYKYGTNCGRCVKVLTNYLFIPLLIEKMFVDS